MNKILEDSLVKLIEKSISGIDAAAGFLQSEVPEYITQLLTWYAVYNFLIFISGIVLFSLLVFLTVTFSGKKRNKDGEFVWTLTHDDDGDINCHALISGFFCFCFGIVSLEMMNLEWLQIWIAPKVWLIEYAAKIAS